MKKAVIFFIAVLFLAGCEKAETIAVDCGKVKDVVLTDNVNEVKKIVTAIAADLDPQPAVDDQAGHRQNFYTLIDRLNGCDVQAMSLCYGCIYTLPETSEIKLVISAGSHSVTRIIDIAPDQSGHLVCTNMHE